MQGYARIIVDYFWLINQMKGRIHTLLLTLAIPLWGWAQTF